jgi:hyperosmotically inducible protein
MTLYNGAMRLVARGPFICVPNGRVEKFNERSQGMKKRSGFLGGLFILVLILGLVACASTSKKASTGEVVDDTVITTKVKSLLAADDLLKSFQISVETYKGIVQLSGFVSSREYANKAASIARDVKGVQSVKNNLIVK